MTPPSSVSADRNRWWPIMTIFKYPIRLPTPDPYVLLGGIKVVAKKKGCDKIEIYKAYCDEHDMPTTSRMSEWCLDNCNGEWKFGDKIPNTRFTRAQIVFELKSDAMAFKLRWI